MSAPCPSGTEEPQGPTGMDGADGVAGPLGYDYTGVVSKVRRSAVCVSVQRAQGWTLPILVRHLPPPQPQRRHPAELLPPFRRDTLPADLCQTLPEPPQVVLPLWSPQLLRVRWQGQVILLIKRTPSSTSVPGP